MCASRGTAPQDATSGEILVKPTEQHDVELCRKYEEAILATSLVLPFDSKVARNYALLRCDRPSALQMPCSWLVLRQQAWICSSPTMRACKTTRWREFSSSCPWTVCRCEASHCGSRLSLPPKSCGAGAHAHLQRHKSGCTVQTADQQHVGIAELYPCTMLEASRRKAIARISVSEKSAG
jgi:hypothetical protein